MCDKSVILFCETCEMPEPSKRDSNLVYLTLDVPGGPLHFEVRINQERATLSDLVPLARAVSSRIAQTVIETSELAGEPIMCQKGCSACCSYLVPLSIPEVFRLRQEVLSLPAEQRDAILHSSVDSAMQILDRKLTRKITDELPQTDSRITANRISRWYAGIKLACPFLSAGLCTWYAKRPLACREHMVSGPASLCAGSWSDMQQVVDMPVSGLEALAELTEEMENSCIEAIMLPFALAWAQDNIERSERTWPTRQMVERFFDILSRMALEHAGGEAVLV
jgi:Fe-S-cluster containining protein